MFSRPRWTVRSAKAWAREHGYKYGDVDVTDNYIHLRQLDPQLYRSMGTFTLGKGIKGRYGKLKYGNPTYAPALLKTIHDDYALHKRKHDIYARLAKKKARGEFQFPRPEIERATKTLIKQAAQKFIRQHKLKRVKPADILTHETKLGVLVNLVQEWLRLWNSGALDQYIPKSLYEQAHKPYKGPGKLTAYYRSP